MQIFLPETPGIIYLARGLSRSWERLLWGFTRNGSNTSTKWRSNLSHRLSLASWTLKIISFFLSFFADCVWTLVLPTIGIWPQPIIIIILLVIIILNATIKTFFCFIFNFSSKIKLIFFSPFYKLIFLSIENFKFWNMWLVNKWAIIHKNDQINCKIIYIIIL